MSRLSRRSAGWAAICAGVVTVLASLAGSKVLAMYAFAVFWCLPLLTVILHVHFTRCLDSTEKAIWRRQLWSWPRALLVIAVWTYLFAGDLRARTRGWAPYKPAEDDSQ